MMVAALVRPDDSISMPTEPMAKAGPLFPASSDPFLRQADPNPGDALVIFAGNARFTVLTPRIVRCEYSPEQPPRFDDRATLGVLHRNVPRATSVMSHFKKNMLEIRLEGWNLRYDGSGPFSKETLSAHREGEQSPWYPTEPDPSNLGGTLRTLDGVSGSTPLEQGLMARSGFAWVDESARPAFEPAKGDDKGAELGAWPVDRGMPAGYVDGYIVFSGENFQAALQNWTMISGPIPMPPRYMLGTWWSRYWAYSEQELRDLVADFDAHDVPLDVLVVDMDWHLDGWTGYSWNPKFFPDPKGFLNWVKEQRLHSTLNLHPADGVGPHETAYAEMALALEHDTSKNAPIKFDSTNRAFADAYLKFLHHPIEKQGLDFWWMDWQQGKTTGVDNLDPLFWLNHLHWVDQTVRALPQRPVIFSRWGGLGNHRYQIGFSGDTYCNWPSLAFQPGFTATAANVGYGWWSHDIGGHQPGQVDAELYTRWIQYGALSPILRTHTTKNPLAERRIWKFPAEYYEASKRAFQFRYELIPYLYSAARTAYDKAVPLVRPLYWEHARHEEAYSASDMYYLGPDIIAAPVVSAGDPLTGCATRTITLPPGEWVDWTTGEIHEGWTTETKLVPLNEIPMFVRSGAMIPMWPIVRRTTPEPDTLRLIVFPGQAIGGFANVYADDGLSNGYATGDFATWAVCWSKTDGDISVSLDPWKGPYVEKLSPRRIVVEFRHTGPVSLVDLNGVSLPEASISYDTATATSTIDCGRLSPTEGYHLTLRPRSIPAGLAGKLRDLGDAWLLPERRVPAAVESAHASMPDNLSARGDRKLLARALGLFVDLNATPRVGGRAGELELQTTVVSLHGDDLSASVTWDAPDGRTLSIADGQTVALPSLLEDSPTTATTRLQLSQPDELPATCLLKGTLTVMKADKSYDFPLAITLLPSINAWHIIGPFDCPQSAELKMVHPPEEGTPDPSGEYAGLGGILATWTTTRRTVSAEHPLDEEFFVDLNDLLDGPHEECCAYALCALESPDDRDAYLAIGSDDGFALWVNRKPVAKIAVGRPYASRQDRVRIRLTKGTNTILLKIGQGAGGWGFSAHIEDKSGKPMTEVVPRLLW